MFDLVWFNSLALRQNRALPLFFSLFIYLFIYFPLASPRFPFMVKALRTHHAMLRIKKVHGPYNCGLNRGGWRKVVDDCRNFSLLPTKSRMGQKNVRRVRITPESCVTSYMYQSPTHQFHHQKIIIRACVWKFSNCISQSIQRCRSFQLFLVVAAEATSSIPGHLGSLWRISLHHPSRQRPPVTREASAFANHTYEYIWME